MFIYFFFYEFILVRCEEIDWLVRWLFGGLVSQFFTARGVRPFMAARSASDERIAALVRAGLGLTVMPRSLGAEGLALKPLAGFDHVRRMGFALEPGEHGRLERSEGFALMVDAARSWAGRLAA